jgi:hypothetical protein
MWHVWGQGEVHRGFGGETRDKVNTWKTYVGVGGRIILKYLFKK